MEALAAAHGIKGRKANGKKAANGHSSKRRKRSRDSSDDSGSDSDGSGSDDGKSRKSKGKSKSRSSTPDLPPGVMLREILRLFLNTADVFGKDRRILTQHSGPSLTTSIPGAAQMCTFSVRYAGICRRIKLELLAQTIEEVFGPKHRSAFEMLTIYGKLDEKNVSAAIEKYTVAA